MTTYPFWQLTVTYPFEFKEGEDFDAGMARRRELDKQLAILTRSISVSSGMGFRERDQQYEFGDAESAQGAQARVVGFGIEGVRVDIFKYEGADRVVRVEV